MTTHLERLILKYIKEYRKQLCINCEYKYFHTCALARAKYNCPLMNVNEKKMVKYIANRLTVLE